MLSTSESGEWKVRKGSYAWKMNWKIEDANYERKVVSSFFSFSSSRFLSLKAAIFPANKTPIHPSFSSFFLLRITSQLKVPVETWNINDMHNEMNCKRFISITSSDIIQTLTRISISEINFASSSNWCGAFELMNDSNLIHTLDEIWWLQLILQWTRSFKLNSRKII